MPILKAHWTTVCAETMLTHHLSEIKNTNKGNLIYVLLFNLPQNKENDFLRSLCRDMLGDYGWGGEKRNQFFQILQKVIIAISCNSYFLFLNNNSVEPL